MVEHRTFNPLVIGSIPILPTNMFGIRLKAGRQTLNLPIVVQIHYPEPNVIWLHRLAVRT